MNKIVLLLITLFTSTTFAGTKKEHTFLRFERYPSGGKLKISALCSKGEGCIDFYGSNTSFFKIGKNNELFLANSEGDYLLGTFASPVNLGKIIELELNPEVEILHSLQFKGFVQYEILGVQRKATKKIKIKINGHNVYKFKSDGYLRLFEKRKHFYGELSEVKIYL